MKITHVSIHYDPVIGGLESVVKSLARAQIGLGFEVNVIASSFGAANLPKVDEVDGVRIYRVASNRLHYPALTISRELPHFKLERDDVVHTHGEGFFSLQFLQWARQQRAITACHFMALGTLRGHPNPIIRLAGPPYQELLLRMASSLSDLRLARSLRDYRIMKNALGDDRVYFVPDGIEESWLNAGGSGARFRSYAGLDEREIVLYVGRLHELKGIGWLIKSIPHVTRNYPNAMFVFVGPGSISRYSSLAKSLGVSDHTLFTGYVDEGLKMAAIDACSVLVLPSVTSYVEVFSMVISEAWARSKPVIATRVGGIPDRIDHERNGLMVEPMNQEALSDAVIRILGDPEFAERLGENGKSELKTWKEIAQDLIGLYQGTRERYNRADSQRN